MPVADPHQGSHTSAEVDEPQEAYAHHVQAARDCILHRGLDRAQAHLVCAAGADPCRPEAFNLMGVVEEIRGNRVAAQVRWRVALDFDVR